MFVRVFYGEKVEKEGRRELWRRDDTSGDKLLKTLTKKKVVQTGIKLKDSYALRAILQRKTCEREKEKAPSNIY